MVTIETGLYLKIAQAVNCKIDIFGFSRHFYIRKYLLRLPTQNTKIPGYLMVYGFSGTNIKCFNLAKKISDIRRKIIEYKLHG